MRTPWIFLLGCAVSACGGTFSNEDLEFLNALPLREELAAQVPTHEVSPEAASGTRGCTHPLLVGEPSELYRETLKASDTFNWGLDHLLALVEGIRQETPTLRARDKRVWGPMRFDWASATHEARFTMTRTGETFDYLLQVRSAGTGEQGWWTFLSGYFRADGGLRRGVGAAHLDLKMAAARGIDLNEEHPGVLSGIKEVDITYQTRTPPFGVELKFVSEQSGRSLRYAYRRLPGALREMAFQVLDANVLPGGQLEDLAVLSRWTEDGRGVAHMKATGGDVTEGLDATQEECWDTRFQVTYRRRGWEGAPEGDAALCPDVSAFGH